MQVTLEAIKFNHNPLDAAADAFNIRKNECKPARFPEWQRGHCFTADDSVAAYAIAPTKPWTGISIQAKFKSSQPNSTIKVQAVDASSPFLTGNVLGTVKENDVTFGANGESGFVPFTLENVRLESVGVGISKNIWRWQFLALGEMRWADFAKTAHKIYSVIDVPQGPWDQVNDETNTQLPWTEVLNVACDWASGAKDVDQAAELITRNVYDLGLGFVGYQGSPAVYALTNFDCTKFLELLRGHAGVGKYFNCSDCATIVSTLSNILGCQTYQVDLPGFLTNPIILLSYSRPHTEGFDAHEVAWTGNTVEQGFVFDACLQVDGDSDPANSTTGFDALLPTNLRFGLPHERHYRFRVASENNIEPALLQRHRRSIGLRVKSSFVDLDPKRLKALEMAYNFESWKGLPSNTSPYEASVSLINSSLLQNWERVNEQSQRFVDGTTLVQFLLSPISTDSEVLLREDIFKCVDVPAARALLLRLLGEYRSVTVKQIAAPVFADIAFLASDQGSVLFASSKHVVLLRSVGRKNISLLEAGLQLGDLLIDLDKPLSTKNNQLRSNLMPHDLKSTFTSLTFNRINKRYEPDFLGDFDLQNIADDGNLDRCTRRMHGLPGKPITGQATTAQPTPFVYDVRIDQFDPIEVHYRGVALRNDAGEVTRIVGHRKIVIGAHPDAAVQALLAAQDETTWVVTKP